MPKYKIYKSEGMAEFEYVENQYEEFFTDKYGFTPPVQARYVMQEEPDYFNNQLIESIPLESTDTKVTKTLINMPYYSNEERSKDNKYRIHAIGRLKDYFYVFTKHIKIASQIGLVIKRGYAGKYIAERSYRENLLITSDLLQNKKADRKGGLSSITPITVNPMPGFTIYGISGGGKTCAVKNILGKFYPQHIIHTNYNGNGVLFHQVVWLFIDCSYNGNLKGICQNILAAFDVALGTNYYMKFGKLERNIDDLINSIAHIAQLHGLGALIIDELQHLAGNKAGIESALNFFVTLENRICIPIIFIGTYKIVNEVLSAEYRQARRAAGIGEIRWGVMEKDEEWDLFIEGMWKYQWTKKNSELNQEMKDTLYEESCGITDRVIVLYITSQLEAILHGTEEVTPALIRKISNEKMNLTLKMKKAMMSGDAEALSKYDDLYQHDTNEIVENYIEKKEEKEKLMKIYESKNFKIDQSKKEIIAAIENHIRELGIDEKMAYKIATNVVLKHGINQELPFLKYEAIKVLLKEKKADKNASTSKKIEKVDKEEFGKEIYQEYQESGRIKSPESDFDL